MITRGDAESERGESGRENGCRDVVSGAGCDVAFFARGESLRSLDSSEIVASIGVVLRVVQWLHIRANLKTRRSADFDSAETTGWREFRRLAAGLCPTSDAQSNNHLSDFSCISGLSWCQANGGLLAIATVQR